MQRFFMKLQGLKPKAVQKKIKVLIYGGIMGTNTLYEEIDRLKAEIEKLENEIVVRDLRILKLLDRYEYKAYKPLIYKEGDEPCNFKSNQ